MSGPVADPLQQTSSPPSSKTLLQGASVVFLLSCAVFTLDIALIRHAPAWHTFEFCQYAEIGRNLTLEGSFTTRVVEPTALAFLDQELDRLNQHSPTPVDYLFLDRNANGIQLEGRWAALAMQHTRPTSSWEDQTLKAYFPVLPLDRTRPPGYVLLRRADVAPSRFESEFVPCRLQIALA